MPRFFAQYNVDACAWEVLDTATNSAVESFSCGRDDELRHYAEHRALAHAARMNQQAEEPAAGGSSEGQSR
ncbi:MAG TPA: hypothetical protein PKY77_15145 [Phycisphaerae bacterium]|nr:hypothetical protein [Phycisphaerae bacterium]HRY68320.1 hypothetical protein [Phycisphaerae bacterium]HSA26797.1 hypothetical protein [Phycisphaerae bacterium]